MTVTSKKKREYWLHKNETVSTAQPIKSVITLWQV